MAYAAGTRSGGGASTLVVSWFSRACGFRLVILALAPPLVWLIAFITSVGFMLSSVVVTHLVAMATDPGVEPLRASRLLAIMKLAFGRLADRAGERAAYAVSIVLEMIALGGILLLPASLELEGITALLGLGIGGNLALSAALITRTLGPTAFGPMMGMKTMSMTPLVATSTPFVGWIFDETDSYRFVFSVFLGLVLRSLVALGRVRPPAHQPWSRPRHST